MGDQHCVRDDQSAAVQADAVIEPPAADAPCYQVRPLPDRGPLDALLLNDNAAMRDLVDEG